MFCPFLIGFKIFFVIEFWVLYITCLLLFCHMFCKYSVTIYGLPIFFLLSFDKQKVFILLKSNWSFFSLWLLLSVSYLGNLCLSPNHEDILLCFPSKSFMALAFMFRSMIHLELTGKFICRKVFLIGLFNCLCWKS